ncbi:MAG: NAD-dependent epimerase/dehydratase family protein [Candidatus Sungbacteria bacterium]|uniref:NAD-dependent epimerase/dehydratase family protein n=1 Tax=Candidatus Sungiibacteriota bacterium TaxID=2750080 RepID=A0A931SAU0_9BACT|nr:NAD-dependent epimerase/dehydratase family protein [Candidatus Sungbacteria bacterium]
MNAIIHEDLEAIAWALGDEAEAFEGKTVLISGGAGFLGSYFVGALHYLNEHEFRKPCRVIVIDNFITGSRSGVLNEISSPHIRAIEADVTKPLHIKEPLDYIIHAAGLASPVYYRKYPLETIEAAVSGAKNLLEFARKKKVASFLFFSSSEIYGDPDPQFIPTPEYYRGNVSSIGPRSCYDESKRLAETLCITYFQQYNVPVKIVRPFNVYGPGMKPDDHRVVPAFLTRSLIGKPLPVHDSGNQTRTFCYISDAIVGFLKVLLSVKNGEVYNVGTDREEIGMKSLAEIITGLSEKNAPIELVSYPESYPSDEPRRRCPDLTKIRSALGYQPKIDLETGLARTLSWYRETLPPSFFEV